MSIFTRLILKEWLRAFIVAVLIFVILITMANVVSELLRGTATLPEILLKFSFDLPNWMSQILPVACMIATLFSLNKMRNTSELLVILASGFPRWKFLVVLAMAGSFVAFIQFINTGYVAPLSQRLSPQILGASKAKFRTKKVQGIQTSSLEGERIWYRSSRYFFSFAGFDYLKNELHVVGMYFFTPNNLAHQVVLAKNAKYLGGQDWQFENGRVFSDLDGLRFPTYEGFKTRIYQIKENTDDFRQIVVDISTLNLKSLRTYIRKVRKLGINANEYETIYFDKIVQVLLCLMFTLLTVTPVFVPNRRGAGPGKSVLFTFVFILVFWFFYSSVVALSSSSKIPAWLGVFFIPALFAFYIVVNIYRNRHVAK